MPSLAEVVAFLEDRFDPAWAEPWDAVGLVCGDPDRAVRRAHLAVDPVASVVTEAVDRGADLLVTHHPLYLGGTSSVAATTSKGRVVHRLIEAGCALYVAHTNADVARPGVNDALADALGVRDAEPLEPRPVEPQDKLVTFAPPEAVDAVLDALAAAGAGTIGDYTRCAFLGEGTGTFRAGEDTSPAAGRAGEVTRTPEVRVEMVLPRAARAAVQRALLAVHPYEEPAWDLLELAAPTSLLGLGRVGDLAAPADLATFAEQVAAALPATTWGIRIAGDPNRPVRRVAVCGGSGGSLAAAAARAGADVLVTSDLKHHAASEACEDYGVALVDAAHWATEWLWLPALAATLRGGGPGVPPDSVTATVSTLVTDPWTLHEHRKDL